MPETIPEIAHLEMTTAEELLLNFAFIYLKEAVYGVQVEGPPILLVLAMAEASGDITSRDWHSLNDKLLKMVHARQRARGERSDA